jgi:chromosome segregation protein
VFLKSLTIKGFKSFADTTVLDFEPGVTVVVGPNGSGKSNVVDAIAWVLGAQGPRTVRSQKMDDVVFAGTAQRSALGRAEVALVIDNSAGLLPVEFTEVTITRTLYRDGDSEYSLNGVPCRLLDVQELLSDAGVGRQQHIIIAQGQIDQVLNARPEDRRTIIEEAAGILKFRRRKERAERRLNSTEANLTRLQDLQREVRRQLRPLERQADAARRHGDLIAELLALRLHLAGRELDSLQKGQAATQAQRATLADEDRVLRSQLAELDVKIMSAESQLAATGDSALDTLPRVESLRERCRGLQALIDERRRAVERDKGALLSDDVVANIEADHARNAAELADLDRQTEAFGPQREELARAQADLDRDRAALTESSDAPQGEQRAVVIGQAAEVRGERNALRTQVQRGDSEEQRLDKRITQLTQRSQSRSGELEGLRNNVTGAQDGEEQLVAAVDAAEVEVAAAAKVVEVATDEAQEARSDLASWSARAEALSLAMGDARSRSGLEKLEDLPGVMGVLAELVEIDAGWEAAVEAAAGDALASVVVANIDAARSALARLVEQNAAGAVLALRPNTTTITPPLLGDPIRHHVSASNPEVEALLDLLLGNAVAVSGGWTEAVDAWLTQPDLLVVTPSGDRCGPHGWRVGKRGQGATAAALEEAETATISAQDRVDAAGAASSGAHERSRAANRQRAEAANALEANDDQLTSAGDAIDRIQRELSEGETERETLSQRRQELGVALSRDRQRVAELEELLPEYEAAEQAVRDAAAETARARDVVGQRAQALSTSSAQLEAKANSLVERGQRLTARQAELELKLVEHEQERVRAAERRVRIEAQLVVLDQLSARLAGRRQGLDFELDRLRARRQELSAAVRAITDGLEQHRKGRALADRRLGEVRELLGRCDINEAEQRMRIENIVLGIRQELDAEPETALAAPLPEVEGGGSPAARVRDLDRELKRMGAINPLALEEFEALNERHDFVAAQLDDVRSGRRELNKVIRAIDEEIIRIFGSAFADVSENFSHLFGTLFPGGTGRLKLTDPDDLLNTGVELEARPGGKNVRKLSLLSGGERSLTALAFLFAIFRSRPSPFYVMDEVEAALDDVNLHRFLELIAEFRREAQLVIVSHQKRTMEAADVLYGVTMAPGGSSTVVSEKVA